MVVRVREMSVIVIRGSHQIMSAVTAINSNNRDNTAIL